MAATNPFDPTAPVTQNPTTVGPPQPPSEDPTSLADAMAARTAGPVQSVQAQTPGGLIANAQTNNVAAAPTAGSVQNANASTYLPSNASTTNWSVGADQTVAGQLDKTIAKGSPLFEKAQADAAQTANGRGLLNSSMAAGAGTAALLDKALQIATPDAQTNANAAQFNAGAANATSQFNANAGNQAGQFNAGNQTQVSLANAGAKNDATRFDAQTGMQAQLANQDAKSRAALTEYDAALKTTLANADAQNKVQLTQLDGEIRQGLAEIEAQFKTQMATSQSAAGMYSDAIKQVGAIMVDKDLDANAKQNLINQTMTSLKNAMNLQAGISNIPGLTDLITGLGTGVSAPPVATTSPTTGQPVTVNPTTGGATTVDTTTGQTVAVNPTTGVPIVSPTTGASVVVNPTTGVATSTNPATGAVVVVSPVTGVAPAPAPAPPPANPWAPTYPYEPGDRN